MATRVWSSSAATGKFDTGANWVGGTAPTNGDSFIIDASSKNIDDGLDQSANTFVNGIIGPNYSGMVGNSDSAPFKCGISGRLTVQGGASQHYIQTGAATIAKFIMLGAGSALSGQVNLGGTITRCVVVKGIVYGYSGTWTEAHISPNAATASATLKILDADIAGVWSHAGVGTIESTSATGRIRALINNSATWTMETGQLDAADMFGGYVNYKSTTSVSGAVRVYGGTFLLGNVQAQTVARLDVYPTGIALINQGAELDTITAQNNFGGTITSGPAL